MKRYEFSIGVYIDATSWESAWDRFRASGLHDLLNELDAEDGYEAELVREFEIAKD